MKIEHFDKLFIVSCGLFWPDLQNGNTELTIIYQNISYIVLLNFLKVFTTSEKNICLLN